MLRLEAAGIGVDIQRRFILSPFSRHCPQVAGAHAQVILFWQKLPPDPRVRGHIATDRTPDPRVRGLPAGGSCQKKKAMPRHGLLKTQDLV